jgi:hypothetical protein
MDERERERFRDESVPRRGYQSGSFSRRSPLQSALRFIATCSKHWVFIFRVSPYYLPGCWDSLCMCATETEGLQASAEPRRRLLTIARDLAPLPPETAALTLPTEFPQRRNGNGGQE